MPGLIDRYQAPFSSGQSLKHLLAFSAVLSVPEDTVGHGIRLLFATNLTFLYSQKGTLDYWEDMTKNYFLPTAGVKFTLWKDNRREEAKPFGSSMTSTVVDMC